MATFHKLVIFIKILKFYVETHNEDCDRFWQYGRDGTLSSSRIWWLLYNPNSDNGV